MRLGLRTLVVLGLCAAAAAAAIAHFAIDIVGDFALPHDTYDDVAHSSRELLSGIALVLACALAARGLRYCFELAATYRTRLPQRLSNIRERVAFLCGAIAASAIAVPAMEVLDGRLAGRPVQELDDAFGGSILLGLLTTVICAALVAAAIYAIAAWLVSHRDTIAAIIETLIYRSASGARPCGRDLVRHLVTPRRRRTPHAYRLCKRGPPRGALPHRHHTLITTEGDSRDYSLHSRVASVDCVRGVAELRRARIRAADAAAPDRCPR